MVAACQRSNNQLATKGGIAAADLAAIRSAAARAAEIDRAQAERLEAIQARLGV